MAHGGLTNISKTKNKKKGAFFFLSFFPPIILSIPFFFIFHKKNTTQGTRTGGSIFKFIVIFSYTFFLKNHTMRFLLGLLSVLLCSTEVNAKQYGEGFMVFLNKDGVNRAELDKNVQVHFGDHIELSTDNQLGERHGCAIDHHAQILFYTTKDPDSTKLLIWSFLFHEDPNFPEAPVAIAKMSNGGDIQGLAVDDRNRNIYISYMDAGKGMVRILKLEDYAITGQSLTKSKNQFGTVACTAGLGGGSIVIIDNIIYVLYMNPAGNAEVAKNDLDAPSDTWEVLSQFSVTTQPLLVGEMVLSDADGKLFISISDGTFPADLHVLDPTSGGADTVHKGIVESFVQGNRPHISSVGDLPGVLATTDSSKSDRAAAYVRLLDGSEDHKIAEAGPSSGPFGPLCWSDPINSKTDPPPTPMPISAAPTEEPATDMTTDAPVVDMSTFPPGVPETDAPVVPVTDAPVDSTTGVPNKETPAPAGPTLVPGETLAPYTVIPQVLVAAPAEEDSDSMLIMIIIICTVVVLLCICAAAIWAYLQRKKEKEALLAAMACRDADLHVCAIFRCAYQKCSLGFDNPRGEPCIPMNGEAFFLHFHFSFF